MVFAGDGDVFHPGSLSERYEFLRAKAHGVKLWRELLVLRHRDVLSLHHPLAAGRHAVDSPVDKHAELGVLEPIPRRPVRYHRGIDGCLIGVHRLVGYGSRRQRSGHQHTE